MRGFARKPLEERLAYVLCEGSVLSDRECVETLKEALALKGFVVNEIRITWMERLRGVAGICDFRAVQYPFAPFTAGKWNGEAYIWLHMLRDVAKEAMWQEMKSGRQSLSGVTNPIREFLEKDFPLRHGV